MITFKNTVNGHVEEISDFTAVWAFIFGIFYFMYRGIWRHVLIQALLIVVLYASLGAPATLLVGIMWVIYAFAAKGIVETSLLRAGYARAGNSGAAPYNPSGLSHAQRTARTEGTNSDQTYAEALAEWESSEKRQAGLWARLYAQHGGDEAKAKAAYINERAQAMAHPAPPPKSSWAANEPLPMPPPRD